MRAGRVTARLELEQETEYMSAFLTIAGEKKQCDSEDSSYEILRFNLRNLKKNSLFCKKYYMNTLSIKFSCF